MIRVLGKSCKKFPVSLIGYGGGRRSRHWKKTTVLKKQNHCCATVRPFDIHEVIENNLNRITFIGSKKLRRIILLVISLVSMLRTKGLPQVLPQKKSRLIPWTWATSVKHWTISRTR